MLQDLKEIRPNIFAVNYGELIRWASCSACCNWLAVFIDKLDQLDYLVTELVAEADKNVSNAGKLPDQISSWKLSALDFSRWVRWMDEPNVVSCLEKDLCISDIVVMYPDFDRIITYLQRLFTNSNNILLYGSDYCGKTTLIKRFVKHITSLDDRYHFIWLQSADRFDALKMQNHFASILRIKCDRKLVLIIDNFHFVEAILPLLEMYCEHNLFIDNGMPQFTDAKLQIILVMREDEYEKLSTNRILVDKFRLVRMQSPSTENLQIIFEQIVLWHLHTKTFNAEYQTLLESMSSATLRVIQLPSVQMPHLVLAQRIAKGMMFAYPDSIPDLDGMIRLWAHETMRCVADSLTSCRQVRRLIEVLERCLKEVFSWGDRSFAKLIGAQNGEKNATEDTVVEGTVQERRSILKKLIFSEIIAPDGIEGIPYTCVTNFDLYQRVMENFLFEFRRVYTVTRDLNLSITGYTMSHVQRVMRVCRQSSEHMALVGHPGSGRTQCVRLATFALNGQTLSVYPDASSHETFERSWRSAVTRAAQLATNTNHPINVLMRLDFCQDQVKPEWLDMLKQWLQQPIAGEMVTDETIVSNGERIIEHEKMLATAMQTSNIRLPGQRSCRFLISETIHSSEALEKILSARVSDFVHFFFVIGPRTIRYLQWCTIDCYLLLGNKEKSEMCMRVLAESELPLPQRLNVLKVLERLCTIFMDNDAEASIASERMTPPESRVHFLLCKTFVKAYLQQKSSIGKRKNILKCALETIAKIIDMSCAGEDSVGNELMRQLDNAEMNLIALKSEYSLKISAFERMKKDLHTKERDLEEIKRKRDELQQKINAVVSKSRSEYDTASEKLRSYTAADYRKLASIKKPMIGVRFTIEAVRCLVDPTFRPQRNSLDTWTTSQELLRSLFLQSVLTKFDVDLVDAIAVQRLKRYLESREFKAAKVEVESNLAASICQWITCVANLVAANSVVRKEYDELKQVMMEMQTLEEDVATLNDSVVGKNSEIIRTGEEISRSEQQVVANRRTLDHIQRCAQILRVTAANQAKWQEELDALSRAFEYLLGDSIFMAAFSVLLCDRSTRIRKIVVPLWKQELKRERIVFTEATCNPEFFITRLLKNVDATERWPLLFEYTGSVVDNLRQLHPASVSVDVHANSWQSEELIQQAERALRTGTTLILHSIRSSPPVEWYPLISVDMEREFEAVHFYERSFSISPNARLFFVASTPRTTFSAQFIHMTSTFVIDEVLDNQQLRQATVQLTDHQRIEDIGLVNLLGEHTASEILDSQEIVEQILAAAS
uniref:Dynein heavy chain 1, axonemal n=1 Tax=Ascaris suum TaxID=6253 RepID=F1KQC4_ASCSU